MYSIPSCSNVIRSSFELKLQRLLLTSLLVYTSLALPSPVSAPSSATETTVNPLYVFPNGTAAENLFVRNDGSVLLNLLAPSAALYYFPTYNSTEPVQLYNFTGSAAAYGITEYAPDTFAVCTGTFSRTGTVTNATGLIWKVDLSHFAIQPNGTITSPARISLLATITDVGFLNGATTLNPDTLLVADSVKGVIYAVDTTRGTHTIALNDTTLQPNTTGPVRLGVNGLQLVHNDNTTLYFTNTNRRTVGKVAVHPANGTAAGPFELIATHILVDDLAIDPRTGAVYIASLVANAITYVAPNGSVSVLAGSLNSTAIPGPTAIKLVPPSTDSAAAAAADHHARTLLISTSGGLEYPINGTYIQGGGLYELNVRPY